MPEIERLGQSKAQPRADRQCQHDQSRLNRVVVHQHFGVEPGCEACLELGQIQSLDELVRRFGSTGQIHRNSWITISTTATTEMLNVTSQKAISPPSRRSRASGSRVSNWSAVLREIRTSLSTPDRGPTVQPHRDGLRQAQGASGKSRRAHRRRSVGHNRTML